MTHAQPRSLAQWLSRITAAGRTIDVTRTHRPTDRIAMTARVSVADGRLRIHRTGVARWLGGWVDVPLAHVRSVDIADQQDVKRWNKGVRLVGFQIPGLMTSGTVRRFRFVPNNLWTYLMNRVCHGFLPPPASGDSRADRDRVLAGLTRKHRPSGGLSCGSRRAVQG